MSKAKIMPKPKASVSESDSVEAQRTVTGDLGGIKDSVLKSLWEDLLLGGAKKVPEQLSGAKTNGGDLAPGQEIMLKKQEIVEMRKAAAHQEYFRKIEHSETIRTEKDQQVIIRRVEEILFELKKIAAVSKEMQMVFKTVTTETTTQEVGIYHLNFYEWLLLLVKNTRAQIEEGAQWMSVFSSKKKQKSYWSMYKKHGTTFGLSQERTAATQSG